MQLLRALADVENKLSQLFYPSRLIPGKLILSSMGITIQACAKDMYKTCVKSKPVKKPKNTSSQVLHKDRLFLSTWKNESLK